MKNFTALLLMLIVIVSSSLVSFADLKSQYTDVKLVKIEIAKTGNIQALVIKDVKTDKTVIINFYDDKTNIKLYKDYKYQYDFINDLLIIKDDKGLIVYDDRIF